jgi:hypothetical protein
MFSLAPGEPGHFDVRQYMSDNGDGREDH